MGKIIVNKHAKTLGEAKNMFSPEDKLYIDKNGDKRQARLGEIVVINDPNKPSIAIVDSNGTVREVIGGNNVSGGEINLSGNSLIHDYNPDGSIKGIKVNVKDDGYIKIAPSTDNEDGGLYVDLGIEQTPEELVSEIEKNRTDISSHTTQISALQGKDSELQSKFGKYDTDINGLKVSNSENSKNIIELKTTVSGHTTDIEALKDEVSKINNLEDVTKMKEDIKANSDNISDLSSNVLSNTNSITTLSNDFQITLPKVESLTEETKKTLESIKKFETRLSTAETAVTEVTTTTIPNINSGMTNMNSAIEKNTEEIEKISNQIKDFSSTEIAGFNEQLKSMDTKVNSLNGDVSSLKENTKNDIMNIDFVSSVNKDGIPDDKFLYLGGKKNENNNKIYELDSTLNICPVNDAFHEDKENNILTKKDGLATALDVKDKFDSITVNSKKIVDNPELSGSDIKVGKGYETPATTYSDKVETVDTLERAIKKVETTLWASMLSISGSLNDINDRIDASVVKAFCDETNTFKPLEPSILYDLTVPLEYFETGGKITLKNYTNGNSMGIMDKTVARKYMFEFTSKSSAVPVVEYETVPDIPAKKIYWKAVPETGLETSHRYLVVVFHDLGEIIDFGTVVPEQ